MNALTQATDPQTEWLYHAPPVGLVLGANIIREDDLMPPRQSAVDSVAVSALLRDGEDGAALANHWAFFTSILGWEAKYVAGAPGGPEAPATLTVSIPEHEIALAPDWAVRDLGSPDGFQVLVKVYPNDDADKRGVLDGWEATPHQQLERLLRETGVSIGVLVDREHIRIIYAPRGETSGWQTFPLRSLATVAGRPMLGGLKLLLGHARLFTEPENRRLPRLLARSREAQNKVSAELAEQVLGALHELLRAFHTADNERIERLVAANPHHLYEGLLTTLMRLVFLLYAEDRELMPTKRAGEGVEVYEQGYSVRGLYARLTQDRALNPDTMDERLGGWGQLLALFRLVHGGHRSGWITARGGKLFDPNEFPFLEGRDAGQPLNEAKVLPVRDGAILRILEGLMTLQAKSITGEKVRERLSYRSLDVEQIGSVYETVMGFTVMRAPSPMIAVKGEKNLPVFVEIGALAAKKGADRQKLLKEAGVSPSGKKLEAIKKADGLDELKAALLTFVDERGSPGGHISNTGAPILQPTDERRRSGSHYTPRSLTEPIVRYALEPAFSRIGDLATPDQVLEIKVCDPACGSGAFLVEASRQLGTRLEKAWARHAELKPAIPSDEDDDIHARRLVAQRCLYGVDKNPMAVDLARLSLWLATLAREHEFTFLDHAIKCGDSLVGLTKAQIQAANWDASKPGLPLLRGLVRDRVNEVVAGRREIQFASDDVKRAIQEARHKTVERRLEQPRAYGDAVIAAFLSADKPKAREKERTRVESLLAGGGSAHWEQIAAIASKLKCGVHPITPFHWELEFPEIFERDNAGFDAVVGNPPFLGGTRIATEISKSYIELLKTLFDFIGNRADLVAYFFQQAYRILRTNGALGLIASNTIAQGDTRNAGPGYLLSLGATIYRATKRFKWPGEAAVVVSMLHIFKGQYVGGSYLNGNLVPTITPFLFPYGPTSDPYGLAQNSAKAAEGMVPYSDGFRLAANEFVSEHQAPSECIVPYARGKKILDDPASSIRESIVYFQDWPLQKCTADFPVEIKLVEKLVKLDRAKRSAEVQGAPWWLFWRPRMTLWNALQRHDSVWVKVRVSPHHSLVKIQKRFVPDTSLVVFLDGSYSNFSTLQSRAHEIWARFFSSSMKDDLRYTPSDCFETFPFPRDFESESNLEVIGLNYHDHRAALMIARNEGMTKTYNRFHDVNENSANIVRLRELHAEIDRAVLRAYGWEDLAGRAEPQFLNEQIEDDHTYQGRLFWSSDFRDEVLARLLKLNAERHAEEARLGIAPDGKGSAEEEVELEEDRET